MGRAFAIMILALAAGACGSDRTPIPTAGPSVTAPSQGNPAPPPPQQQGGPISFSGLAGDGTPVTTYTESGFTVTATAGNWVVGAGYGNPRPFMRFGAPAGDTVTGEIQITAAGAPFTFTAIDLYSSTTPIPYSITARRNGSIVFQLAGTVPNTFGNFRTVTNPDASGAIDTLTISLSNAAAPCCPNPMGVDTIAVAR